MVLNDEDSQLGAGDSVIDGVGKTSQGARANIAFDDRPPFGPLLDLRERSVECPHESIAQTSNAIFVESGCFD